MEFLAEDNVCGQTLLRLVSRGNAIIAELWRLSDFIPPVFRMETPEDREKYQFILPDFSYFRGADFYDHKLDSSSVGFRGNMFLLGINQTNLTVQLSGCICCRRCKTWTKSSARITWRF